MIDPARRAAEQAVVRAALQRRWLSLAVVTDARRAAEADDAPLLTRLGALLDPGQQQALARIHEEALAEALGQPSPAPPPAVWTGSSGAATRADETKGDPAPGAADEGPTYAEGVDPGASRPADPRSTFMPYAPAAPPARALPPTGAGESTDGAARGSVVEAPARLGPYAIERELARGGMGAVFVARDVELGRRVALKVMLPEAGDDDGARFEREGRVLARLSHPNIVTLHAAGVDEGRRWLALELVPGGSLQDRLSREGPLEPRVAVGLLEPVARAIHVAHDQGLLHRDLKPANILLDEAGRPKVTDFGIARPLDAHTRQLTRTGVALGTPCFAPPEQCGGGRPIDARADVYGLGATLYALLAGRPPFEGSFLEVVTQVVRREPAPPSRHRPGVPPELDLVALRCLAKDPAERYPSAAALADELGRWLRGEPLEVQPPGLAQRARRAVRRHWAPVLGLLALGLLGALGAPLVLRRAPAGPTPTGPAPTEVRWLSPADGAETSAASIELRGVIGTSAAWVDLGVVGGAPPARLRRPDFTLVAPLAPGDNEVALRWTSASGEAGTLPARRIRSTPVPSWFAATPERARPRLPLPDGLVFTDQAGVYRWTKDGSELVWVPPATFTLQAPGCAVDPTRSPNDHPRRTTLTRGCFMGRHELTWKQLDRFCRETGRELHRREIDYRVFNTATLEGGREPLDPPFRADDDHCAYNLSWFEAVEYLEWAGLRMPTEAEWELAARGTDGRAYPTGNDVPKAGDINGMFDGDGYEHTAPVGRFENDRSPSGCYDMAGNVSEWVSDRYGPIDPAPQTDPTGPATGERRVARGGPWHHPPACVQLTLRWEADPSAWSCTIGLRVALSPRE